MSRWLFGCIGAVLGLIVGVVLVVSANLFLATRAPNTLVVPSPDPARPDITIKLTAALVNSQLQAAI